MTRNCSCWIVTSGLDPARASDDGDPAKLQRLGKTIIISSHILSELQTLCNRVAIIEKGQLIWRAGAGCARPDGAGEGDLGAGVE
jgi:ABC-type multidrug transport system ATPase subunit